MLARADIRFIGLTRAALANMDELLPRLSAATPEEILDGLDVSVVTPEPILERLTFLGDLRVGEPYGLERDAVAAARHVKEEVERNAERMAHVLRWAFAAWRWCSYRQRRRVPEETLAAIVNTTLSAYAFTSVAKLMTLRPIRETPPQWMVSHASLALRHPISVIDGIATELRASGWEQLFWVEADATDRVLSTSRLRLWIPSRSLFRAAGDLTEQVFFTALYPQILSAKAENALCEWNPMYWAEHPERLQCIARDQLILDVATLHQLQTSPSEELVDLGRRCTEFLRTAVAEGGVEGYPTLSGKRAEVLVDLMLFRTQYLRPDHRP